MFKIYKTTGGFFYIKDENDNRLHSDGRVLPTVESWPTRADAEAVLDKFCPKHIWKHGDVFKYSSGAIMIYILLKTTSSVYCLRPGSHRPNKNYHPNRAGDLSYLYESVEFLFNIKDKL